MLVARYDDIYIYHQDLTLNSLQGLKYHKIQPTIRKRTLDQFELKTLVSTRLNNDEHFLYLNG